MLMQAGQRGRRDAEAGGPWDLRGSLWARPVLLTRGSWASCPGPHCPGTSWQGWGGERECCWGCGTVVGAPAVQGSVWPGRGIVPLRRPPREPLDPTAGMYCGGYGGFGSSGSGPEPWHSCLSRAHVRPGGHRAPRGNGLASALGCTGGPGRGLWALGSCPQCLCEARADQHAAGMMARVGLAKWAGCF